MTTLEKYLVDKHGLDKIAKKTVTQYAIDNLVAFSVSVGKKVTISFPLFKDETKGGHSTAKENKQRDEFIERVKEEENVDLSKAAPVVTFEDETAAVNFLKRHKIVKLAKEYTSFSDVQSDFTVGVEELDGRVLQYRSNIPTEVEIMRDVFRNKEYERKGLKIETNDIIIDLGGNIGAFTCSVFDRAKKVITFEPEDVNFEFLSSNVEKNKAKNVEIFKKAVVGNDDKTRDFYVGKVPYYYSFLVKHNRKRVPVECVNINEIMKKYKPTKMKIDIEGSEWEVLTNCTDFGNVKQLIFEYNFDMNKDLKTGFANFDILTKHLKKHGFDVTELENYSRSKSWADVFLCNRVKVGKK